MRALVVPHILAAAIVAVAFLALPTHLRAVSAERLRGQAWLSFCGPTGASTLGEWGEGANRF